MKKYCECFALGVFCGDACSCAVCKNNAEGIEKIRPEREEGRKKKSKKEEDHGSDLEIGASDGEEDKLVVALGGPEYSMNTQDSVNLFLNNNKANTNEWLDDQYGSSQNSQFSQCLFFFEFKINTTTKKRINI